MRGDRFQEPTKQKHETDSCYAIVDNAHLCFYIVERRPTHDGEAYQEDISLRIRKWTESVIVLLPSSIPEPKTDWFPIDHHIRRVIVKARAMS